MIILVIVTIYSDPEHWDSKTVCQNVSRLLIRKYTAVPGWQAPFTTLLSALRSFCPKP